MQASSDSTDSRFAVISPMKRPEADDTETGLPVTSAILEFSKLHKKALTCDEELKHQTVKFSQLNAEALATIHCRQQKEASRKIPAGATLVQEEVEVELHHPLEAHGTEKDHSRAEEPYVRVSFRTNVPLKGKTCFAIAHRMSDTVGTLRQHLITSLGVRPTGSVTIHRSDTGELLPNHITLLDCGFRFPPLLRVQNYLHEWFLLCSRPLTIRAPLAWAPTMTLTDMLKQVHKRLMPRDMRQIRLTVNLADGTARVVEAAQRCIRKPEPLFLNPETLLGALMASRPQAQASIAPVSDDPITVEFLRSKGGVPVVYALPFTAAWSVGRVMEFLHDALQTTSGLLSTLEDPMVEELAENCEPFDDEDEEVYLSAESMGNDPLPAGRHDAPRRLFLWPRAEYAAVFGAPRSGLLVSYMPPPSAVAWSEPRFVEIEEDFLVPHLTDLGIFPGMEVTVEFFDPLNGRWSGELEPIMTASLLPSPVAVGTAPHFVAPALRHGEDLLTIRSTATNQIVRMPCTPLTTFDNILLMYWACTGELPMLTVLQSENGRLLAPFETIASANLLPQATLYASHRPRVWLREALVDVTRVAGHAKAFSNSVEPNLW